MDTFRQVEDGSTSKSESLGAPQRQQRSIAEKRRIVEETLVEGASVARVARVHGINANQVFGCETSPLQCAGLNRHEAENANFLRERVSDPLGSEFCAGHREVHGEA